jgi:hypothetical protein
MRHVPRALLTPLVAIACVGWLELLRSAPGPRIGLVLPLREAGHADAVSAILLVVVVLAAFAALARVLPPTGSPVVGACLRAAGAAAVIIVIQAASIELVRQAVIGFDWTAALRSPLPWLVGIGAALATLLVAGMQAEPAPAIQPPPQEAAPKPRPAHETPSAPQHEAAAT